MLEHMFDWSWISELDGNTAADQLALSRNRVIEAEAEQFLLAAHWADLHVPEFVEDCRTVLSGMEKPVDAGADGCPQIEEFAGAELAALLGKSTHAGEQLIADAVNVRHRHPMLWAGIQEGTVRVWVATKVARRCASARLTREQAVWVDTRTTPYLATLPLKRFFDLVDATIVLADPAAAAERAEAEALRRFAHAGKSDEHGMRTFIARAHAGDVTYLVAVLDRMAAVLAEQGDTDLIEARRATALRILANPARALALLTGATLEALGPSEPCDRAAGDPFEEPLMDLDPDTGELTEDAAWMLDGGGGSLPGTPRRPLVEPSSDGPCCGAGAEEAADPGLLRQVLTALDGFDASRLDPVTVFYVHLSDAALSSRTGVARVEGIGPMVLDQLKAWLADPLAGSHRIHLRPVLDAADVVPVDRYEIPPKMSELISIRNPYEVFPYGTLPSRDADNDHGDPYRRDGPLGQTSLANLGPLGRKHHRLKTHGRWLLHHPRPGTYWWRAPHGHWFEVDAAGTRHHGRDPALDASLGCAPSHQLSQAG